MGVGAPGLRIMDMGIFDKQTNGGLFRRKAAHERTACETERDATRKTTAEWLAQGDRMVTEARVATVTGYDKETGKITAQFTNARGEREVFQPTEPVKTTAPPTTSIVGSVVITLDKARKTYITRRDALQAEITVKTEELRQTTAALLAIETGMIELGGDAALTEGELALIDELVRVSIDQIELQLDERKSNAQKIADAFRNAGVGPHSEELV